MAKVDIHRLDEQGNDIVAGSFLWDGQQLTMDPPDSELLQEILEDEIPVGPSRFTKDEPEDFLHALHFQYRSAYLRATEPYDPAQVSQEQVQQPQ
jgi:hypothetical protein